ncbi:D-arabinono-1,4-lactone oxidase [Nocardioides panacisoli]|uniref:D-arabinono-1,4-lactone oxidase n=1 Tax=Nocardioides panacisoli TaxID=627624 RepID=A0ABP7J872_9ACTN
MPEKTPPPWRNWARTEEARPARVLTPRSAGDVAAAVTDAVRDGLTVRAIGSGHSFSGAAVAPGVQLRPDALDGVLAIDRDTGVVRVEAGIPLYRLNPVLLRHGLAMEILGDIDRQTIAGAIATGTHGSSRHFGTISTQVRALELVLADGSVVECSPSENAELFEAARTSLGAFGVITKVTLQCVPLYALRVVDAPMPVDEVLERFDELVDENDHFEFFWFPHTSTAITRRFQRLPGDTELAPMSRLTRAIDDKIITNLGFDALLRFGTAAPRTVPAITRLVTKSLGAREFTDLAPNVFASERNVRFKEGEYAVPRAAAVDCLRELRRRIDASDEKVSFPFEVRHVRADDIPLSVAHERDVVPISFHQYHRMPHQSFFSLCEDVLGAAEGRPHWGKIHRLDADALRGRYKRFDDFVGLRDRLDPTGVFANPYLDRVLGPVPEAPEARS